ncbi:hypothetical protein [Streptomyces sp. NPDC059080]
MKRIFFCVATAVAMLSISTASASATPTAVTPSVQKSAACFPGQVMW